MRNNGRMHMRRSRERESASPPAHPRTSAGSEPPASCQQASTLPVGVTTRRSSTTSSGHSAAALPRTAATSAATSALLASTGCCTRQGPLQAYPQESKDAAECSPCLEKRLILLQMRVCADGPVTIFFSRCVLVRQQPRALKVVVIG